MKRIMNRLYCFAVRMYYKVWRNTNITGHIWVEEEDKVIYCERCGKKR
jgi:hypothetical protein